MHKVEMQVKIEARIFESNSKNSVCSFFGNRHYFNIKCSHFFCILQLTGNDIFVIIKMDFYFMKKKQFRKGVET